MNKNNLLLSLDIMITKVHLIIDTITNKINKI